MFVSRAGFFSVVIPAATQGLLPERSVKMKKMSQ